VFIYGKNDPNDKRSYKVSEVRLAEAEPRLLQSVEEKLSSAFPMDDVVSRIVNWLAPRLDSSATTLTFDQTASLQVREQAAAEVEPRMTPFRKGDILAQPGQPIDEQTIALLLAEYSAHVESLSMTSLIARLAAALGMYTAMFTLCGVFIRFRYPEFLDDQRRLASLIALSAAAIILAYWTHAWNAEIIPLLLFAMTVTIAYNQELSLLCSAAVGLIIVFSTGQGIAEFVILMAATATAVLLLRRIRSRTKLIYVGLAVGLVTALTTIGVNLVESQSLNYEYLLRDAGIFGLFGLLSGVAMSGLLPFIEEAFGVLTDLSLLELGDVAHPLLQELVRRAPGTYNHSINVASMAEAAADSIGAAGLLVRVGAYFHDIGKMLKPQYFVENQGESGNRHESLVPAMSTLIIIAHVKDGADLARQHHLPQPIIDFIQQHHGTTLVEYFYRRASEDSQNKDAGEVDENAFRYPGPKPQSKEAGILMLADAVESASRVLVEPTPSRIENLVNELAMKRLLDGQLDESGLTLQEVRAVETSLVKSLTAVYHGRVKYPQQRTA